ncbi:MAG: response regulator transcription factor, partial [Leptolyngbyaceae cyanobacterium CRU_2_3]|nr:response regulator transcription factor [Leptolyngbyaceae cyanobacterium CRU_2_3]
MSVDAPPSANHSFQLILIDEDAVFRLGLRVWLERYADLKVVAEVQTAEAALQILAERSPPAS